MLTSYRTISEIYTTEVPSGASAATVPSSTVTVTQTAMLRKRQASGTGPITATPVVATAPGALMSSIESACLTPTGLNLLLINSYSSACTCFLTPNVDTIFVTVTTVGTLLQLSFGSRLNFCLRLVLSPEMTVWHRLRKRSHREFQLLQKHWSRRAPP